MNQYKMDWYLASQLAGEMAVQNLKAHQREIQNSHPHHRNQFNKTMDLATETVARGVMTYAAPKIMKHLAQNQITGTIGKMGRVGGRIGLRAVPILGVAMMAKDAHSLIKFLLD